MQTGQFKAMEGKQRQECRWRVNKWKRLLTELAPWRCQLVKLQHVPLQRATGQGLVPVSWRVFGPLWPLWVLCALKPGHPLAGLYVSCTGLCFLGRFEKVEIMIKRISKAALGSHSPLVSK